MELEVTSEEISQMNTGLMNPKNGKCKQNCDHINRQAKKVGESVIPGWGEGIDLISWATLVGFHRLSTGTFYINLDSCPFWNLKTSFLDGSTSN